MDTLFFWTLGATIVLLAASGILLAISAHKKKQAATEAFAREGAQKTAASGDLWLDENNRKWLIAREGTNLPVHRYDSVRCAELSENGVRYIWNDNNIVSAEDEHAWPPSEEHAQEVGMNGKKQAISLCLNIFTDDVVYPVETLVLLSRPCARTSKAYRDAAAHAAALMHFFNTMHSNAQ